MVQHFAGRRGVRRRAKNPPNIIKRGMGAQAMKKRGWVSGKAKVVQHFAGVRYLERALAPNYMLYVFQIGEGAKEGGWGEGPGTVVGPFRP